MCHARRLLAVRAVSGTVTVKHDNIPAPRFSVFAEYSPYGCSGLLQSVQPVTVNPITRFGVAPSPRLEPSLFMGPVETLQAWNQLARIDVNQRAAELGLSHLIHIGPRVINLAPKAALPVH